MAAATELDSAITTVATWAAGLEADREVRAAEVEADGARVVGATEVGQEEEVRAETIRIGMMPTGHVCSRPIR